MTGKLFLCVDCGGSKTAVAIADAKGNIVAQSIGGPSNFAYIGLENFVRTIKAAVEDALKSYAATKSSPNELGLPEDISLPIEPSLFAAAWFGVSGCDGVSAASRLTAGVAPLLSLPLGPRLRVNNDTHLLAAPLDLHPDATYAIAAIAGTGSCNVSFQKSNVGVGVEELARCGGWGWLLGDEGAGFHVGREVLRQIMIEYDRASLFGSSLAPPASIISKKVVATFGVETPPDLLTVIHDPDPPNDKEGLAELQALSTSLPAHRLIPREKRLSQLAPIVFEAAFVDKDPVAIRTLEITSSALADQIEVLLSPYTASLGVGDSTGPNAIRASSSIICFGGSLAGIKLYRDMILDALRRHGHEFMYVAFVEDASIAGAKALAAQIGGLDTDI